MSSSADPLTAAFEHHQAGRLLPAEQIYRQLLIQDPDRADAWHLLGVLCLQSGRPAEAIDLIGHAIAIQANQPDYYNHLGAAYGALGQHDEAVATLRRAVQSAPRSPVAHYNLGTALRNAGRLEEAVASFRHAVAANPDAAEAHYNLANTLVELKRPAEAEASYREALRARPRYPKAMVNLAGALRDQGRLAEAIGVLREAIAIEPGYTRAHLNLGIGLRDAGLLAEAETTLRRAAALEPASAEAQNVLGTALQAQARFAEASSCYDEALRLDPNFGDAHFSRATTLLRQGNLVEGFAEYEWRWKCKSYSTRRFSEPRWHGAPLAGQAILLHAEQGLGDTLQFARFAQAVQGRGAHVIVECQPELMRILASCPGIDQLLPAGAPPPKFDVHCPLMSLPGVLKLTMSQLACGPYLAADAGLVELWRGRLVRDNAFRVGICWRGNPKHLFDAQRSFALAHFAAVAAVEGVRLISLQRGPGTEEIAHSRFEVVDLGPELDDAAGAFMDRAAVIKNLDLVITTDTAVAHLAGAFGAQAWVALSSHGDWRWFMDRQDSPWYPTMRLFRQQQLGQWQDVFERLAAELEDLIARR